MNRFLSTSTNGTSALDDGTTPIHASVLGAANLQSSLPLKTDSLKRLISTKLSVSDVNNLQSELDGKIQNGSDITLSASEFQLLGTGETMSSLVYNDTALDGRIDTIETNTTYLTSSLIPTRTINSGQFESTKTVFANNGIILPVSTESISWTGDGSIQGNADGQLKLTGVDNINLEAPNNLRIGSTGNQYTLPSIKTTKDQVLRTDATGNMQWTSQNQTLNKSDNVIFGSVKSSSLDTETAVPLIIGSTNSSKIDLSQVNDMTTIKGHCTIDQNLTVTGITQTNDIDTRIEAVPLNIGTVAASTINISKLNDMTTVNGDLTVNGTINGVSGVISTESNISDASEVLPINITTFDISLAPNAILPYSGSVWSFTSPVVVGNTMFIAYGTKNGAGPSFNPLKTAIASYDLTNPDQPTLIQKYLISDGVTTDGYSGIARNNFVIRGKWAIVTQVKGSTFLVDISDSGNLSKEIITVNPNVGQAMDSDIRGRFLYIITTNDVVEVWDMHNPTPAYITASVDLGFSDHADYESGGFMNIFGSNIYCCNAAATNDAIQILEITEANTQPTLLIGINRAAICLAYYGNYLYVGVRGENKVVAHAYDVSNPTVAPVITPARHIETSSIGTGYFCEDIRIVGDSMIMSGRNPRELFIMDIPTGSELFHDPTYTGSGAGQTGIFRTCLTGDRLYTFAFSGTDVHTYTIGAKKFSSLNSGSIKTSVLNAGDVQIAQGLNVRGATSLSAVRVDDDMMIDGDLKVDGEVDCDRIYCDSVNTLSVDTTGILSLGGTDSSSVHIGKTSAGTPTRVKSDLLCEKGIEVLGSTQLNGSVVPTGTLATISNSEIFTNKIIDDVTNTVSCNSLRTTGASVNVSSAAAPGVGQVLKTTTATTATWQTPTPADVTSNITSNAANEVCVFTGTSGKQITRVFNTTCETALMNIGGDLKFRNLVFAGGLPALAGLYSATSSTTITTTSEVTMIPSGEGYLTMPANTADVGNAIKIVMGGYLTVSGNGKTLTLRTKFGATTLNTTVMAIASSPTNTYFDFDLNFVMRAIGTSGTVTVNGRLSYFDNGNILKGYQIVETTPVSIDTTVANTINVTGQWNDTGQTITVQRVNVSTLY